MVTVHRLIDGQPPEVVEVWPVDAREYMARGWIAGPPASETPAGIPATPAPTAAQAAAWLGGKSKRDLVELADKLGVPSDGTKDTLSAVLLSHVLAGTVSIDAVALFSPPLATGFTPH